MGWTVLYIAFGIVALWLLGEVLLQHKARLRWRLLAFVGFLGVVVGAVLPSVPLIGVGVAAFATGQTFVTLSFRGGFTSGWTLGGRPGSSRRRRGSDAPRDADPSLEVSGLEAHTPETSPMPDPVDDYAEYGSPSAPPPPSAAEATAVAGYQNFDGYDGYGNHDTAAPYGEPGGYGSYDGQQPAYGTYPTPDETQPFTFDGGAQPTAPAQPAYSGYQEGWPGYEGAGGGVPGYDTQGPPAPQPAYGAAYGTGGYDPSYDPSYGAYDPYAGAAAGSSEYAAYDYGTPGGVADPAGSALPGQQPYTPYHPEVPDTPPGGVWVPQQRGLGEQQPPGAYDYGWPEGDPAAPQYGQDNGYGGPRGY